MPNSRRVRNACRPRSRHVWKRTQIEQLEDRTMLSMLAGTDSPDLLEVFRIDRVNQDVVDDIGPGGDSLSIRLVSDTNRNGVFGDQGDQINVTNVEDSSIAITYHQ